MNVVFQVSVFEVEAVDLQAVTKIVVGHDGLEAKEGWYLDKIVVSVVDELQTAHSWIFNSQRYSDVTVLSYSTMPNV